MKVLLATDGSAHAEEAARHLARLPHTTKLELTILCVHQPPDIHGSLEAVSWVKEEMEKDKSRASDACDRIAEMFEGADVDVHKNLQGGHPGKTILNEAEKLGADLIVMGAEGQSTLERIMLGSTSDFVATHAHCSVLIVRPAPPDNRDTQNLKLCVAYDDSDPSRFAVEQLKQFEWGPSAHVDVVTVLSLPYNYLGDTLEVDNTAVRTAALQVSTQAVEQLSSISPDVHAHTIEDNHVGTALVNFASENGTHLIVMGDTGRGLLGTFFLGSVSRWVLRHAPCAVWIAREQKPS